MFETGMPEMGTDEKLLDTLAAPPETAPQAAVLGGGAFKLLYICRYGSYVDCAVGPYFMMLGTLFLRLTYPTMRANTSAFALLPTFVEICGRKCDATDETLAQPSASI